MIDNTIWDYDLLRKYINLILEKKNARTAEIYHQSWRDCNNNKYNITTIKYLHKIV